MKQEKIKNLINLFISIAVTFKLIINIIVNKKTVKYENEADRTE